MTENGALQISGNKFKYSINGAEAWGSSCENENYTVN